MLSVMLKKLFVPLFVVVSLAAASGVYFYSPTVGALSPTLSIVAAQEKAPVGEIIVNQTKHSWPWYVSRGSGLAAAGLLVLLMLSGIGFLTGHTYKVLEPLTAWTSHRALGIAFGVSTLVHVFVLLFDKHVVFNPITLLVPFASDFKPLVIGSVSLGSMYIALGILAFYAVIAVVLSSIIWIDKKPHTWRLIHYLSYFAMFAVFVHALYLGTDLRGGAFRTLWVASGIAIFIAICVRLWRAQTSKTNG